MKLRSLHTLIFYLLSLAMAMGQTSSDGFTAFGYIPKRAPAKFYEGYNKAKNANERLAYLDSLAYSYRLQDNPDSLVYYGLEILQGIDRSPLDEGLTTMYKLKSRYYLAEGKSKEGLFEAALSYYLEGLSLAKGKTTLDAELHQKMLLGLSRTYLNLGEAAKAKNRLQRLKELSLPKSLQPELYLTLTDYELLHGSDNNALEALGRSEAVLDTLKHPKLFQELQYRRAILDFRKDATSQDALTMLTQIKTVALKEGYYDLYIKSIIEEAKYHYRQGNNDVVEMALSTAYVNTVQWNRLSLQKYVQQTLRKFYTLQNDYENAHNIMTQYLSVNEAILNKQNRQAARELEARFETLEKEQEILNLQREQQRKESEIDRQKTIKKALLIGFFIVLIPVILLLVVYYQKLQTQSALNRQQELLNEQEMRGLLQEQEIKIIKASISAQQEERERIARQLHDQIGGDLAAMKLQLQNKSDTNSNDKIVRHLDGLYEQVREISHDLVPKTFASSQFLDLIREYLDTLQESTKLNINFVAFPEEDLNSLPERLQLELFNTLKELAVNVNKHASASELTVDLTMRETDDTVALMVEDNGKGFEKNNPSHGLGLSNLQNRASRLGGFFNIDSTVGRGTLVHVEFPIIENHEQAV